MTVKELIEQLQQVENQDIEVVIRGTGLDDWVYMNEIEYTKQTKCIMDDEMDLQGEERIRFIGLIEVDELIEEDEDDVIKVFVIDGGMF